MSFNYPPPPDYLSSGRPSTNVCYLLILSHNDCGHHRVEQAVVYSTLPQEYSTLTFRGEIVAGGGGVEEKSEVMYWHRGAYIIYYMEHNMSQLYSVTDGGLGPHP